jgi:predicted phosphodiesterase
MAGIAGAKAGDVIGFGHTHLPYERVVEGIRFVNTGSVGRPKDGDRRAGFVVLDFDGPDPTAEFARVEYDVKRAASAIRESELPSEFADFLEAGGRPATASP